MLANQSLGGVWFVECNISELESVNGLKYDGSGMEYNQVNHMFGRHKSLYDFGFWAEFMGPTCLVGFVYLMIL